MQESRAVVRPCNRALRIEYQSVSTVEHAISTLIQIDWYNRQVIVFAFLEILREHAATIAVDTYRSRVKTKRLDFVKCNGMQS